MTYDEALRRLTSLCSRAEYCAGDLCAKLERWDINKEEQAKIIRYLQEENYINEQRFCRLYARDKLRFNRWGRTKIRLTLAMKGVDKETIDNALDELDEGEYNSVLLQLLRQKARLTKSDSDYERDMKLLRYAAGHGFTSEEIRKCLPDV